MTVLLQQFKYQDVFLLFRKPASSEELCTSNKLVEFIPSSNPCSQTEDIFALTKNVVEEESIQDKYLKIDYATEFKEQWQGKVFQSLFSHFIF